MESFNMVTEEWKTDKNLPEDKLGHSAVTMCEGWWDFEWNFLVKDLGQVLI